MPDCECGRTYLAVGVKAMAGNDGIVHRETKCSLPVYHSNPPVGVYPKPTWQQRALEAEATIQRVRELCDGAEARLAQVNAPLRPDQRFTNPQVDVRLIRQALDSEQ